MTLARRLLPPEWIKPPSDLRWMAAVAFLLMVSDMNREPKVIIIRTVSSVLYVITHKHSLQHNESAIRADSACHMAYSILSVPFSYHHAVFPLREILRYAISSILKLRIAKISR